MAHPKHIRQKLDAELAEHLRKGRLRKAAQALDAILEKDRDDDRLFVKRAELALKQGDEQVVRASYRGAADAAERKGFYLRAMSALRQLARYQAPPERPWLELAELAQRLGLVADALGYLDEGLRAWEATEERSKVLEAVRRSSELAPDDVRRTLRLAQALRDAGRLADGQALLAAETERHRAAGRDEAAGQLGRERERLDPAAPRPLPPVAPRAAQPTPPPRAAPTPPPTPPPTPTPVASLPLPSGERAGVRVSPPPPPVADLPLPSGERAGVRVSPPPPPVADLPLPSGERAGVRGLVPPAPPPRLPVPVGPGLSTPPPPLPTSILVAVAGPPPLPSLARPASPAMPPPRLPSTVAAPAPEEGDDEVIDLGGPEVSVEDEVVDLAGEGVSVEDDPDLAPVAAPVPVAAAAPRESRAPAESMEGPIHTDLSDDLAHAEFLITHHFEDEARELLDGLAAEHPGHPSIEALVAKLAAGRELVKPHRKPVAPATLESIEVATVHAAPGTAPEVGPPPSPASAATSALPLELLEAVEFATAEEVLQRFREGVAAEVASDDVATHYDLGIAYREMGLLTEALAEFEAALTSATGPKAVDCLVAMALCQGASGQEGEAIRTLKRALTHPALTPAGAAAVFYEIGHLRERQGDPEAAARAFQAADRSVAGFRDARARAAAQQPAA